MTGKRNLELVLRRATAADRATLMGLAARLAGFDVPPWRTAEEIAAADGRAMVASAEAGAQGDEVLIAERSGVVVGCLHMIETTDFFGRRHAHLSVIAVSEEAEGTGVGRVLMDRAEEWARARGLPFLTLNVFAANTRARGLYERAGFTPEVLRYAKAMV
jgi:ribosomal protein S18 acetylase RimI-like enzyme